MNALFWLWNKFMYVIELLHYCSENSKHFDKIKKIQICKIEDNSIENMLTKNAYVYQHDNTLHVSNPENYNLYTEHLVKDFLHNLVMLKSECFRAFLL